MNENDRDEIEVEEHEIAYHLGIRELARRSAHVSSLFQGGVGGRDDDVAVWAWAEDIWQTAIAELQAQVERLTAERDEALKAVTEIGGRALVAVDGMHAAREQVVQLTEAAKRDQDALLILWAEMPAEQVVELRETMPALVEYLAHLHHSIEHEQAMMRRNVWADHAVISQEPTE